jgi:proteic killer suppression protein
VIRSFRCKETQDVFEGRYSKKFNNIAYPAEKKLMQIHAAVRLADLAKFPGNRLETLKGDRRGQHSIRINDQYRVCFAWDGTDAHAVEIVDYH